MRSTYYIFRDSILPAWEDPNNVGGGALIITLKFTELAEQSEFVFMSILLLIIGNTIPQTEEICGVCYSKTKEEIEIWLSANCDYGELEQHLLESLSFLGTLFKSTLSSNSFQYKAHRRQSAHY